MAETTAIVARAMKEYGFCILVGANESIYYKKEGVLIKRAPGGGWDLIPNNTWHPSEVAAMRAAYEDSGSGLARVAGDTQARDKRY